MRSHIETVAGRYKGRVHAWDVVNEVIDGGGIRIDGIGMQGHWGLNYPKTEYIESAIDAFAALFRRDRQPRPAFDAVVAVAASARP
jgi:GH35 family endo-1,4-beta-xylanase